MDHLKMGLIRSDATDLTPMPPEDALSGYLWPIVREMIKTAIENSQNLIVEGCYIPFDWEKDFSPGYLEHIRYHCLIMSEGYIRKHFVGIQGYTNVIENRLDDNWCTPEALIEDNRVRLELAKEHGVNYILIDKTYEIPIE